MKNNVNAPYLSSPLIEKVYSYLGNDQESMASGQTTADTLPRLVGSATPHSSVMIFDNGVCIGVVNADERGVWTFEPELGSGVHNLVVAAPDGTASAPFVLTVDPAATSAPTISAIYDTQNGAQEHLNNGDTAHHTHLHLVGRADSYDEVNIFDKGVFLGKVYADANGNWTFTSDLGNGEHNLTVSTPGGGVSAPYELNVESAVAPAPIAPTIESAYDMSGDSQGQLHNGDTTDETHPRLMGTAEAYSSVAILDNGVFIGNAYADNNGNWTFQPELGNGVHNLTVATADGTTSVPFVLNVESASAPAPIAPTIELAYDMSGDSQGQLHNGDTTDETHPRLMGTAEAYSAVTIFDNGVSIGSAYADNNGNWMFLPELGNGVHNLTVATADGTTSAPFVLNVETAAAPTPIAPTIDSAYDMSGDSQGYLHNGDSTDETHPRLTGSAEPGSDVAILDNGAFVGIAHADNNGLWTFTPELGDGKHTLTASTINGSMSEPFVLTIDIPPAPPTSDLYIDGLRFDDGLRPTFQGSADAFSQLTIYDGERVIGQARADSSGHWTFTPSENLTVGLHSFSVGTADAVGTHPYTAYVTGYTDGELHISSAIGAAHNSADVVHSGETIHDNHPRLLGQADASSWVTIYDGSEPIGTVQANLNGAWRFEPPAAMSDGVHTLTVADDQGHVSKPFVMTVETNTVNSLSADIPSHDVLSNGEADLFSIEPMHDNASLSVQDIAQAAHVDMPQSVMAAHDTPVSPLASLLPQEHVHVVM